MSKRFAWNLADERDRPLVDSLLEMHTWTRPAGSWADERFRQTYLYPLENIAQGFIVDAIGNIHVTVGDDDGRIMFSSHTDTVHENPGRQRVTIDRDGMLRLAGRSKRRQDCLGADDTVGVWLMVEMIKAHIPGHYVFHFGEECGTVGSNAIREEMQDFLQTFDIAIAFDRKDTNEIITYQCGDRTCSDAFAIGLASALNGAVPGLTYRPSPNGVYTDTERYADVIPECTNVSVGYYRQHTDNEYVDVSHVLRLRQALIAADWSKLPVNRNPAIVDSLRSQWSIARVWNRPDYGDVSPNPDGWSNEVDETKVRYRHEDDDEVVGTVDLIRKCEACDLEYWTSESNARLKLRFCDRMCEAFKMGGLYAS